MAAVDGEFIVKRLYKRGGVIKLMSENKEKNYPPIVFNEGQELIVFGVVTNAINPI
ncbi:MAG: S24 family peptidase [Methylophilaceae bacterium]|nr:S24 family peptidase [Methylophilaceae bacterium]